MTHKVLDAYEDGHYLFNLVCAIANSPFKPAWAAYSYSPTHSFPKTVLKTLRDALANDKPSVTVDVYTFNEYDLTIYKEVVFVKRNRKRS